MDRMTLVVMGFDTILLVAMYAVFCFVWVTGCIVVSLLLADWLKRGDPWIRKILKSVLK